MATEHIDQIIDRWMNDTAFRSSLRADPQSTIRGMGISLSDEEQTALRSIDWSLSDDALSERISKGGG
jgi:hypothetical protein